jgi:hypothetical protein
MFNHLEQRIFFNAENERLLNLYKTFLVVEVLQKNAKDALVLDLAKASFFAFVIGNHNLTRRVLTFFKPEIKLDERFFVKDIYENFIYPGNVFEDSDFKNNVAVLCDKGLLDISTKNNEIFLRTAVSLTAPENSLVILWRDSLTKLKPLVAKSITQLYKGLLENPNA